MVNLRKILLNLSRRQESLMYLTCRSFSTTMNRMNSQSSSKSVAMILSGCGVYDGSEIVETTSAMIHLSRHNANVSFFAPNIEQLHVINHLTGNVEPETRNVLVESARITRGNIKPLDKLVATQFDALILPGGFGAAKNLSSFAINGTKMTVNKQVEKALNDFVLAMKPIGVCCISPVILAKLIKKCELTVGKRETATSKDEWPYAGTLDAINEMGATCVERDVDEICVDESRKIVSTPAYMKSASFSQVYDGIGKMIEQVLKMA